MEEVSALQVCTPEAFTPEQKLMGKTAADFVTREVLPVLDEIEEQHFEHSIRLLKEAGDLGLLSTDIPEAYGGLGLDMVSSAYITENFALARSFALSYGVQTGIGSLPIVFFGNERQKEKYLPRIATGDLLCAYALTEPGSGSDALGARTRAVLSPCGQYYLLSGEKQWITNAGFADLFIVYAKVDGEQFTAFIVEKAFSGVSVGPEEKKMGIKGSSTRTLLLDHAQVPVENVLGEIGRGHVIAFNILNLGRFKLGVGCVGSTKRAIQLATQYAKERKQFNTPLAKFNLIKAKLANMAIKTYVAESVVYRTAGLIEEAMARIREQEQPEQSEVARLLAEYALESSICKVFASETLDFVVDEAVQIHGGYGYMSEYEVENMYRDARINRIFEGTNEINRLLIMDTLMRKAVKGELPISRLAARLEEELLQYIPEEVGEAPLVRERHYLAMAKKLLLLLAGTAWKKYGEALAKEQEVVANLADLVMELFAMESALLRTEQAIGKRGLEQESLKYKYTVVYAQEAFQRMEAIGREVLAALEAGDNLFIMLSILRKLTRHTPVDTIGLKREIAEQIIQAGTYRV